MIPLWAAYAELQQAWRCPRLCAIQCHGYAMKIAPNEEKAKAIIESSMKKLSGALGKLQGIICKNLKDVKELAMVISKVCPKKVARIAMLAIGAHLGP